MSSDSDISNLYLYDSNNNQLAVGSFNNGIVTFTGSPLFTVSANGSATVEVRADMSSSAATGDSIGYGIASASDINAGSVTFSGNFPVNGNLFTIAAVTNLGSLLITSPSTLSTTINPGQTGVNVGYFQFQGSNQPLSVSYIKLTNVGSVGQNDIQNLKLMYNGSTQVGVTEQQNADKTVVFDLSANPMTIPSGNLVNLYLVGDVLSGSTRTYQFTIQRTSDVEVTDTTYNTGIVPSLITTGGQSPVPSGTTNQVTINSGSASLSVDSTSPTGNIATGAVGQPLAIFSFTGSGEDIRVSSLTVSVTTAGIGGGSNSDYFQNGKLVDVTGGGTGTQIGSVQNLNVDTASSTPVTTSFNIPGYWVIPAGGTRKLAVESDVKAGTATAAELNNGTITASITSVTAQGVNSLQTVNFGTATGRTLTMSAGALTESQNYAFPGGSLASPTGVPNQTGVKLGSFLLTAGSAEAVNVNQVTITTDATSSSQYQNVKAYSTPAGGTATQIGQVYATVTNSQGLTFSPSQQLQIPAGSSVVIDVYGDLQGNVGAGSITSPVSLTAVTATGATDNQAITATLSNGGAGQNAYIAASGALTVGTDSSAPTAQQLQELVSGATSQTVAVFNLAASPSENINVTKVTVTDTETATNTGIGDFNNLELYVPVNGVPTPVCNGLTVGSLIPVSSTTSSAVWNLQTCPIVVPLGSNISMTVKANVTFPLQGSGASHNFNLASGAVVGQGAVSGVATATSAAVSGVNASVYRTNLTIAQDSSSPSGLTSANATQTVAVFDLTNANNSYGNQATVLPTTILGAVSTSTLSFGIASTLPVPSGGGNRVFSVYQGNNLVLQATITASTSGASGNWNGTLTFTNTDGVASAQFYPSGNTVLGTGGGVTGTVTINPIVLNSGSTLAYTVKFDTTDAVTGKTFTLSFPAQGGGTSGVGQTSITWADGYTSVSKVNSTNVPPVTFGTLQY